MVYPWRVVGCEEWTNDNNEECVRLYVQRSFQPEKGFGVETQRLFYKKKYIQYEPVAGHLIIAQIGRYGISQIVVVGNVEASA